MGRRGPVGLLVNKFTLAPRDLSLNPAQGDIVGLGACGGCPKAFQSKLKLKPVN